MWNDDTNSDLQYSDYSHKGYGFGCMIGDGFGDGGGYGDGCGDGIGDSWVKVDGDSRHSDLDKRGGCRGDGLGEGPSFGNMKYL